MVNLMTLHSAKGLEFDTVFLPGWEEGLFPNQRAMEENGLAALEEERRLAYVGLTRARHRAYVCFAANRASTGSGRIRSVRALSTSCRSTMSRSSQNSGCSLVRPGTQRGQARPRWPRRLGNRQIRSDARC